MLTSLLDVDQMVDSAVDYGFQNLDPDVTTVDPRVLMSDPRAETAFQEWTALGQQTKNADLASSTPQSSNPDDTAGVLSMPSRKTKLPVQATNTLKGWLDRHKGNPYPSQDEKEELSSLTGLSLQQINIWFANARKRKLNPISAPRIATSEQRSPSVSSLTRGHYPQRNGTMERDSSCDSIQSDFVASVRSGSRKGRKRLYSDEQTAVNAHKRSKSISTDASDSESETTFQCTFCGIPLSSKAWKRHEETQHLPQTTWTCMADGPIIRRAREGSIIDFICAFCGDLAVDRCEKDHRIAECLARESTNRTFFRKEHLRQHFNNCHPLSQLSDEVAEYWSDNPDYGTRTWICGFCGDRFTIWNARVKHVAKHFRQGKTMADWETPTSSNYVLEPQRPSQIPLPNSLEHWLAIVAEDREPGSLSCPCEIYTTAPRDDNHLWFEKASVTELQMTYEVSVCVCLLNKSITYHHVEFRGALVRFWLTTIVRAHIQFHDVRTASIKFVLAKGVSSQNQQQNIQNNDRSDQHSHGSSDSEHRTNCHELRLKEESDELLTRLTRWISAQTQNMQSWTGLSQPTDLPYNYPPHREEPGKYWPCPLCIFCFHSRIDRDAHLAFHGISSTTSIAPKDPILGRIVVTPFGSRYGPQASHDSYECRFELTRGGTTGCHKRFGSLAAFAQHLISTVGRFVCIARLFDEPPGRGHWKLETLQLAELGLPEQLLTFYPSLVLIDWKTLHLAESTSDPTTVQERKALSTIYSVSSRASNNTRSLSIRTQSIRGSSNSATSNWTPSIRGESSRASGSSKPANINRYSSSFSRRRARYWIVGEDENNDSSDSESINDPKAGASSPMPSDEDDNLADFVRLLVEKKELKSFNRAHPVSSDPSMRRTIAELSKYLAMRDSIAEVSESISSSLLLSSSSSSEQASADPPGITGTRDSNSGSSSALLSMTDFEEAPLGPAVTVSRHQGTYISTVTNMY